MGNKRIHSAPSTLIRAFLEAHKWRAKSRNKPYRRTVRLYHLETGSCEGCAMEISALTGSAFALRGSGFSLVDAPSDADWLIVTGAITKSSASVLASAWEAMPRKRSLIAIGACALNGGPWGGGYSTLGGLEKLSRVERYVPGCPPSPQEILYALEGFLEGGR